MFKTNDRGCLAKACVRLGVFLLLLALSPCHSWGADDTPDLVPPPPEVPAAPEVVPAVPAEAVPEVPAVTEAKPEVPAAPVAPEVPVAPVAPAPEVPAPAVPDTTPAAVPAPAVPAEKEKEVPAPVKEGKKEEQVKPAAAVNDQPMIINDREEVTRQEAMIVAKTYTTTAYKAWRNGKFKEAMDNYEKAEEYYKKVSKSKREVLREMENIRSCKAEATREWADAIAADARKYARAERFDDAITKCRQAMELDNSMRDEMKDRIRIFTEQKKKAEFDHRTSPDVVDTDKAVRSSDINILLEQGKIFLANERYSDARDKFERILLKDPTDIRAIRLLKQIDLKLGEVSVERRRAMQARRLAEVSWKWVEPVSLDAELGEEVLAGKKIDKTDRGGNDLQRKLRTINFPKIEFEDATISQVVAYLKKRSQEIDPEGIGVNIVLHVPPAEGGGQRPAPVAAAPEGGAEAPVDGGVPGAVPGAVPGGAVDGGAALAVPASNVYSRTLTISMNNVPMDEAIRYVCMSAGLKYRIDRTAVMIADKNESIDAMETHFYPVPGPVLEQAKVAEALQLGAAPNMGKRDGAAAAGGDGGGESATSPAGLQKTFSAYGVTFDQGSGISYNAAISKLIVHNTPENLEKVRRVLEEINIDTQQVTIEAKFVEVSVTDMESLGFEWMITEGEGDFTDGMHGGSGSAKYSVLKQGGASPYDTLLSNGMRGLNQSSLLPNGATSIDSILGVNSIIGSAHLNTIIHALSQSSSTNLLSSPKVTAMSGNEAILEMVEQRYFPTSWGQSQINTQVGGGVGGGAVATITPGLPEFGDPTNIGVTLKVTPAVRDGRIINLTLEPQVTEFLRYDKELNQTGKMGEDEFEFKAEMPIILSRRVQTQVEIYDGETLVLGGFISEDEKSYKDKIPLLGDLPLLGFLFQSTGKRVEKRNLLIFVTARLVKPDGVPVRSNNRHGMPDFRF